jgi:succinate-acetate transporter protein
VSAIRRLAWILTLGAAGTRALGCAACFGRSDSPMAQGMNWGIFTLLVVVAVMLSLIASFFVFIVRRQSRIEAGQGSENLS